MNKKLTVVFIFLLTVTAKAQIDDKQLLRSKESEKQGCNYSAVINSKLKRTINGKELTCVQDLFDSTNIKQGELYVELLNDSIFRTLSIIDGNKLKYLVGDGILTNLKDTEYFATENYYGFKLLVRCKYYFTIEIADKTGRGISDARTISYLKEEDGFGNPYIN